jgi:hypothetical protein
LAGEGGSVNTLLAKQHRPNENIMVELPFSPSVKGTQFLHRDDVEMETEFN